MLFRFLAHQESHYAYADLCIHPHAAVCTTMSTQSEVQHKRADEEEDRQGGSSKAQEGASTPTMGSGAPKPSTTTDASGVNMITGDGIGKKTAAMAGPARMIGPQVKGAETTAGRGKASQKRALSGRALDVDLVNSAARRLNAHRVGA